MKVFLISICTALLLSVPGTAIAKKDQPQHADIKVSYNYHKIFVRGSDGVIEKDIDMLLVANTQTSKFYSPRANMIDSLHSTPKGKATYDKMFDASINEYMKTRDRSSMISVSYPIYMYVFKSLSQATTTVYDNVSLNEFEYYSEPYAEMQWEVKDDSTKTIMGYECMMAETDYHGRHWTVWFTPEIPIGDGPWKFCGLPGLILEASEDSGQHTFTANGIEKSNMEITPIYNPDKYTKSDRLSMLKSDRAYRNNPSAIINATLGQNLMPAEMPNAEAEKYDFLETDYHEK